MKIALLGYGKMGKTIEKLATAKGHEIVFKSDENCIDLLKNGQINGAAVAIEFTGPESAAENIKACIIGGIPVVSGSTGWLKHH
jgi:4-hydroxy-tetrahydrodipicolinate reductase